MKKKAKQIAKVMSNDSLEVVAQMIADEAKGVRYEVYADGSSKKESVVVAGLCFIRERLSIVGNIHLSQPK